MVPRFRDLARLRTRAGVLRLVAMICCGLGTHVAGWAQSGPYESDRRVPGVVAALQSAATRFNESNSVIVVQDHGLVLIDVPAAPSAARSLIDLVKSVEVETARSLRYLVFTHWHSDHVQTNGLFRAAFSDVVFVAHDSVVEDIRERAAPALLEEIDQLSGAIVDARQRLELGTDRSGAKLDRSGIEQLSDSIDRAERRAEQLALIKIEEPTLTFTDHLRLESRRRPIDLFHRPGHTRGDVLAWLAQQRLVVTGDLLDDLPFGGHGNLEQWLETFDFMDELDMERFIPGHGRVRIGDQADNHLRRVRALFETIAAEVDSALSDGVALEALQASMDWSSFKEELVGEDPVGGRAFDQFVPATLEREYRRKSAR